MTRRASLVLVAVFLAGFTAACAGDGSEGRQAGLPSGPVVESPAVPDSAGAARVVRAWLVTIQDRGLKAACPFMTPEFQRQSRAYSCGNPNEHDSPPFMTVDYRDADVRVRSQDGDIAIVEVTFPDGQGPSTTYSARYDHIESRWLVAGRFPAQS